jgi:hypothetical protein
MASNRFTHRAPIVCLWEGVDERIDTRVRVLLIRGIVRTQPELLKHSSASSLARAVFATIVSVKNDTLVGACELSHSNSVSNKFKAKRMRHDPRLESIWARLRDIHSGRYK